MAWLKLTYEQEKRYKGFATVLIRQHNNAKKREVNDEYRRMGKPIPLEHLNSAQRTLVKTAANRFKALAKTQVGDGWFVPDKTPTQVRQLISSWSRKYKRIHGKDIKFKVSTKPWRDIYCPHVGSRKRVFNDRVGVAIFRVA